MKCNGQGYFTTVDLRKHLSKLFSRTLSSNLLRLRESSSNQLSISFCPFYNDDAKGYWLSNDIGALSRFIECIHTSIKICFGVVYLCKSHSPDILFRCLCELAT